MSKAAKKAAQKSKQKAAAKAVIGVLACFVGSWLFLATAASAQPPTWAPILVSGNVGYSFISQYSGTGFNSENPLLGVDAVYNVRDVVHLGLFYEHNSLSLQTGGGGGALRYLGLYTRIRAAPAAESNVFLDLKLGLAEMSSSDTGSGGMGSGVRSAGYGFGFGIGGIYIRPINQRFAVAVRFGYRILHSNLNQPGQPLHELDPSLSWVVAL